MNCLIQSEIVEKFKDMRVGALFMEMGTGKTKTILDIYKSKNLTCKIIYICPASLVKSTKEEVKKWGEFDIEFFTCESLGSSDTNYLAIYEFLSSTPCFLVIDESIKFKNLSSKRTQRLLKIAQLAKYRFILNGTPITRSILDLLAQMDILSPKILNLTEAQFANLFLEYKLEDGRKAPWRSWSKPHNEEELMKMISPYIAEASLDLNVGASLEKEYFNLSLEEKDSYNERKREILSSVFENRFLEIAQQFQHHYTFCREKIEALKQEIKDDTLIFVKFKKWFEVLREELDFEFGVYNAEQKDDLNNFNVAVLSYGCGAFGLNLQKFNRVIFLDQTFDYGQKIQAISRVRRLGQTRDIKIFDFYTNTGLENIIEKSLDKKTGSSENVKTILKNLSKEEIEKL